MLRALLTGLRQELFRRQGATHSWRVRQFSKCSEGQPGIESAYNQIWRQTAPHFLQQSVSETPLDGWLKSLGLSDWDLQRISPVIRQQLSQCKIEQLKRHYKSLSTQQQLGSNQQLPQLLREHPRLLLPSKYQGAHLQPEERIKRKWYPQSMLEALELHAGGLSAALQALRVQPELEKLQPVLFAEQARKLKHLGVIPKHINLLAVKSPTLFKQQSFLKTVENGMALLHYFCKVLGHNPVYLLLKRMSLLRGCRLPEVQKRVAFMDMHGYQGYRQKLNWVRLSPKRFCQELNCSQQEFLNFKKDLASGKPGLSGARKQKTRTK